MLHRTVIVASRGRSRSCLCVFSPFRLFVLFSFPFPPFSFVLFIFSSYLQSPSPQSLSFRLSCVAVSYSHLAVRSFRDLASSTVWCPYHHAHRRWIYFQPFLICRQRARNSFTLWREECSRPHLLHHRCRPITLHSIQGLLFVEVPVVVVVASRCGF